MNPFKEYFLGTFQKKYAIFTGRASRSEYWYFMLFSLLIIIPTIFLFSYIIVTATRGGDSRMLSFMTTGILLMFWISWIIPAIALSVRRLHDSGRSGWWYLLVFVPLGSLVLFIFTLLESQPGRNKWGPNPWETEVEDEISQHLIDDFSL